jgi:hypothetical protein
VFGAFVTNVLPIHLACLLYEYTGMDGGDEGRDASEVS